MTDKEKLIEYMNAIALILEIVENYSEEDYLQEISSVIDELYKRLSVEKFDENAKIHFGYGGDYQLDI